MLQDVSFSHNSLDHRQTDVTMMPIADQYNQLKND